MAYKFNPFTGTFDIVGGSDSSAVAGPSSSVNNHVVFFDGTTGKLIKDSGLALSGNNTGDQDLSGLVPKTTTVNSKALSGNIIITKSDVGLGNVANVDQTVASNITSGTIDGDRLPAMSTTKKGAVPATGTPSGKFLKDDGTWATSGGGSPAGTSGQFQFNNSGAFGGGGKYYPTGTYGDRAEFAYLNPTNIGYKEIPFMNETGGFLTSYSGFWFDQSIGMLHVPYIDGFFALDQTNPQTIVNGSPTFDAGLNTNDNIYIEGSYGSTMFNNYSTPLIIRATSGNTANVVIDSSTGSNPNAGFIVIGGGAAWTGALTGYYCGTNNDTNFRFAPFLTIDETGYSAGKDGNTGLTMQRTGEIGIGTKYPTALIDVNGDGVFQGTNYFGGPVTDPDGNWTQTFIGGDNYYGYIGRFMAGTSYEYAQMKILTRGNAAGMVFGTQPNSGTQKGFIQAFGDSFGNDTLMILNGYGGAGNIEAGSIFGTNYYINGSPGWSGTVQISPDTLAGQYTQGYMTVTNGLVTDYYAPY